MMRGLIELSEDLPEEVLRRLVLAAYRASARGEVVLAVSPELVAPVESILDEAVATVGLDVSGVRFFRGDPEELFELARRAPLTVASSAVLRTKLTERGFTFSTPAEELHALQESPGVPEDASSPPHEDRRTDQRTRKLLTVEAS